MAVIPYVDIAKLLDDAGFPNGVPLVTGIAVLCAESGRNPDATHNNVGPPPSVDRGLWQINSYWHPEVSDECAFDPVCSTKEALRISGQGSSYTQWAAYNNGQYLKYFETAKAANDGWQRIEKLNAKIADLTDEIGALEGQVASLQAQVTELAGENADLTTQVGALTVSLNALTASHSALVDAATDARDTLIGALA